MRIGAVAAALLAVTAGCVGLGGCVGGGGKPVRDGYVASDVGGAEVVRVAWPFLREDGSVRVRLEGEAAVTDGVFDVAALLAAQPASPPPRECGFAFMEDPGTDADAAPIPMAFGGLVAVAHTVGPGELGGDELNRAVVAAATDLGVLWAERDVPRASVEGRRIESSVLAGLQVVRLRPCRIPVECQGLGEILEDSGQGDELCADPFPDDGMILLQAR